MHHDQDVVAIRLEPDDMDDAATIWFEVDLSMGGYASLYLGADTGSRGIAQTLRLKLSNATDPFADLARFAEQAYQGTMPVAIDLDHEGPESRLTLRPAAAGKHAVLEVYDLYTPVVCLAAIVEAQQVGLALARALRIALANPAFVPHWNEWFFRHGQTAPFDHGYFGSAWLRDLVIEEQPGGEYAGDGIDTYNQRRYHWG